MSSLYTRIQENRRRQCAVRNCFRARGCLSQYCRLHRDRTTYNGHPEARHIKETEYAGSIKLARDFMKTYRDHAATIAALGIMGELLDPGPEPPLRRIPGRKAQPMPRWYAWRELDRLAKATPRVTAEESLEAVLTVWFKSYYEPHTWPSDGTPLTYAIAARIFGLRPFWCYRYAGGRILRSLRPGGHARNIFGRAVRRQLASFLGNVTALLAEQERQQRERAMALRTPLVPVASA